MMTQRQAWKVLESQIGLPKRDLIEMGWRLLSAAGTPYGAAYSFARSLNRREVTVIIQDAPVSIGNHQ